MRNCKFAQTILTYLPARDKWVQNAKLKENRISPSCCFAKQFFYVFGGMVESGSFDVKHSESIERF